jgi:hypothetical protein
MSSRLEDLRDLARMLDEGKISQTEYDIVKTELLEAPAAEWGSPGPSTDQDQLTVGDASNVEAESGSGWRKAFDRIPKLYRLAGAGAVLVLVVGFSLAGRSGAAGSVTVEPAALATTSAGPASGSLGILLEDLTEGWNAVDDPPLIVEGITTTPEAGRFDSFLHRFDASSILAGAYDPGDGSVYALMVQSGLGNEAIANLYIHLCYLLHPGSQGCLDTFIEATGMFGRSHADLLGTEQAITWEFEEHTWQWDIASEIETIRVQGEVGP